MKTFWTILLIIVFFVSCKKERKINVSFYYWNTVFDLSETDENLLTSSATGTIYLRCFDVDWIGEMNGVFPVAPIRFASTVPAGIEIVPVIYITNQALIKLNENEIPVLSRKIRRKLNDVLGKDF